MNIKSRLSLFICTALTAALISACAGDMDTVEISSDQSALTELSPDGRYIVQFANNNGREMAALRASSIAVDLPHRNFMAAYLSNADVSALRNNPNVLSVEPDQRRYPTAEVTPYGITMVQADQLPPAPAPGDPKVKVCVIDSGLKGDHEDFGGVSVSGTNVNGTGQWSTDLCGHGTHVAGTIAAAAGNGLGVVGVGPDAIELHIVKVFGDSCAWTYSSDLVSALDVCTAAGADVVSMSLGGGFPSGAEDNAFQQAFNNGVLSIAAAGNDGNNTLSYPASYDSVMSVAAIDSNKVVADFSQQNSQVEIAAPGVAVTSTYPYANSVSAPSDTYNGNQIEFAASGNASGTLVDGGLCLSSGSWAGATVLCERGDISFFDKVINVQNGGGVAAIIYNNAPGGFSGTLGAGNSSAIPAISLSQADGQALLGDAGAQGDTVSGVLGNGYADLDGTSMATPHVAGVAALVWAHFPNETNQAIRDALTATAEDLGSGGRDNAYGHGLVQAQAAYDFLTDGGGPVCLPKGSSCTSDSDCCSNKCKGGRNKSCK